MHIFMPVRGVSFLVMPLLNAIGIVTFDMARSIRHYRLLGVEPPETPDEGMSTGFF